MELLGERPAWSMSGAEVLSALDRLDADLARRETYRLQLIARMDVLEHAQEIGAHNTAQLLEFRYRLDRSRALRDVRLARSLAKYDAVSTALPDPHEDPDSADGDADEATEVVLRPAQAEAIVSALDQVPSKVPADDVAVAERELIGLARHLSPFELRKAGQRIRDVLDTDGPEPEEHKAFARETLTLTTADRGVKFRGYLANENAELLRSLIHAGARPHKTLDGEPDPRSREKRQADALTTTLAIAATALDAGTPTPRTPRPAHTTTNTPSPDRHPSSPRPTDAGTASPSPHPPRTSDTTDTPAASDASAAPGASGASAMSAGSCASAASSPSSASSASAASSPSSASGASGASAASGASGASSMPCANSAPAEDVGGRVIGREGATGAGAGRGPDGAGDVPGFGAKANITVIIDLQDLKSAAADAIGDTVYGDGLSAAAIRRLACDAKVIPLVLGANSEPLDVGRCERLVTRAMRRALNARDRGCVVCGAPPIQCDAHHLISWIDGGETKISNLVLLCRRHHIDVHGGDWTITIVNGEVQVARPTWADPPRRHRTTPKIPNTTAPPHAARSTSMSNDKPSANHSPDHDRANPSPTHVPSADRSPTKHAAYDDTPPEASPNHPPAIQASASHLPPGQATHDRLPVGQATNDRAAHDPAANDCEANDPGANDCEANDPGANDWEADGRGGDGWEADDDGSAERSVARAAVASVIRRSAIGRELLRRLRSAKGSTHESSAIESGVEEPSATSFGEAAYEAIWGEATVPQPEQLITPRQIPIAGPRPEDLLEPRTDRSGKPSGNPMPTTFHRAS